MIERVGGRGRENLASKRWWEWCERKPSFTLSSGERKLFRKEDGLPLNWDFRSSAARISWLRVHKVFMGKGNPRPSLRNYLINKKQKLFEGGTDRSGFKLGSLHNKTLSLRLERPRIIIWKDQVQEINSRKSRQEWPKLLVHGNVKRSESKFETITLPQTQFPPRVTQVRSMTFSNKWPTTFTKDSLPI